MTDKQARKGRFKIVLFDLDGTFADTAADLAHALNQTLQLHGEPTLSLEQIRPAVSHGGIALIRLGFNIELKDPRFESLRHDLLRFYIQDICLHTTLFPGMEPLLQRLEENNIPWGIVTNKPEWLTNPLMQQLQMTERAACIVCGDTTPNPKPHPEPILLACKLAGGHNPSECIYIGDAKRDIEAGNSAGTATLTALFGYIDENDNPDEWGADGTIEHPSQILDWLDLPD
jgi:N-acetyl-D-muramate 6-phosphate phosphatase